MRKYPECKECGKVLFPSQSSKAYAFCPDGHGRLIRADMPRSIAAWRKYIERKPFLDGLPIAEKARVGGKATRKGKRLFNVSGKDGGYIIAKMKVPDDAEPVKGNVLAKTETETSVFVREFTPVD